VHALEEPEAARAAQRVEEVLAGGPHLVDAWLTMDRERARGADTRSLLSRHPGRRSYGLLPAFGNAWTSI
jgi:hypothetical protein